MYGVYTSKKEDNTMVQKSTQGHNSVWWVTKKQNKATTEQNKKSKSTTIWQKKAYKNGYFQNQL